MNEYEKRLELTRKYLEVTKKYLRTACDELGKIRGGIKLAMAIENAYWREIDDLPPLVEVEEVTLTKCLTQKVEVVKSKRPTRKKSSEPKASGPADWVWVHKKGEKATMVPNSLVSKYLAEGWSEGSGRMWITDEVDEQRIDPIEFKKWQKKGWREGRKPKNTE
jgi:hypothetical protein